MSGKNNKAIKNSMIKKYGKKCFIEELGLRTREEIEQDLKRFKKSKRAELLMLTFHHIKERRYGGAATEENGAILRNINHIWFNSLDMNEQRRINKLFQEYKAQDKFKRDKFKESLRVNTKAKTIEVSAGLININNNRDIISEQVIESISDNNNNNDGRDSNSNNDGRDIDVIDFGISDEEYKKYIEARRRREREKWQGRIWGIDDREDEER